MRRGTDVILPARFLLTIGYFVVTVMAFSSVDSCVAAGLPFDATAAQFEAGRQSMLSALSLSIIAFIIQFLGLLLGFSLFKDGTNLLHCVLNFFGGVLLAWQIVDQWSAPSTWAIVVPFSLLPGLMELYGAAAAGLTRRIKL